MTVCHATSIRLDDDHVVYFGLQGAFWRIPVAMIEVVGEFTTDSFGDDHFVAFVVDADGQWFQAPGCAAGLEPLLTELGERLRGTIEPGLASSTAFHSRVLWPTALAGHDMFEFGADGVTGRPGPGSRQSLHPDVLQYLARVPRPTHE